MKIRVTGTCRNSNVLAHRAIQSVTDQTFKDWSLDCFVSETFKPMDTTFHQAVIAANANGLGNRIKIHRKMENEGVFDNLLPLWRSFDDDDIIVWLDMDDALSCAQALQIVHNMHAVNGAMVTYGQFIWDDGTLGICKPLLEGRTARYSAWTTSHLKTFRAGLVKKIKDSDLRDASGQYSRFVTDQNIMLPLLEMAPDHAMFCSKVLYVYNARQSHTALHPEDIEKELAEVRRIRALPIYDQEVFWSKNDIKQQVAFDGACADEASPRKEEKSGPAPVIKDGKLVSRLTPDPYPLLKVSPRVIPTISETGYWSGENIDKAHCMSEPLANWISLFLRGEEDKPIYDFGCGVGAYLARLLKDGFKSVCGIEAVRPEKSLIVPSDYLLRDLTLPIDVFEPPATFRKGHVISLEVAEHIPARLESGFLRNIANACDGLLIMSWAVMGQGGDGHVNCQDNLYAIQAVERQGFKLFKDATDSARRVISDVYDESRGELPWFKNTLLIFKKS